LGEETAVFCFVAYVVNKSCIREQDTQHNTQQERTQASNTNTHAHREDLYAFENKTRSTGHNRREHKPATQTRMRIGGIIY
jgi:hypothetical protein